MSLERRRRLVEVAAERELLVLEDNPYGLLRYEGDPQPTLYALDGGEYVIYLGTFSKILSPGPAPGLDGGAAAGAREDGPRQGRRRPLLVLALPALRVRLLRRARLAPLPHHADRALPAPPRHDARRAGRALPRRGDLDAAGGRAVHLGDAARLHRHDRPAGAGAARERRLRPGPRGLPRRPRRLLDAPELLRRRRGRHPRGRAPDRQGRARAGRALRHADRRGAGEAAGAGRRPPAADEPNVLPLRRRAQ